jgi:hypothetical protein
MNDGAAGERHSPAFSKDRKAPMTSTKPDRRGRAGSAALVATCIFTTAAFCQESTPARPVKPAPAKIEQVRKARAEGLLGQPVMDANGDVFGHVVDVLIDADGTPHAAVIEFAGFFGIGDRRVAVAWDALQFKTQQDHIAIVVPLDIPKLKAMPEYTQEANSVPVATPSAPQPKLKSGAAAPGAAGAAAPGVAGAAAPVAAGAAAPGASATASPGPETAPAGPAGQPPAAVAPTQGPPPGPRSPQPQPSAPDATPPQPATPARPH